ncbi:beta-galactosidase [Ereboglobus sp. PH5-10]|uniref:rhamnogalacturonan lyase family protein n=1 Tax=Ereboglobus sp. PH5-10 TaxID=2940629 RepID=UPI0024057605|nr:beta-galactosidase [Ereboglobus sp. PH5-10]
MEALDRGAAAVPAKDGGILVSWRLLATDAQETKFDIYRDGKKINTSPLDGATNFVDKAGTPQSVYIIRTLDDGANAGAGATAKVWADGYLSIPLQRPPAGVTPTGEHYTYSANEASVADLDGDGRYEIILKWDPSNSKDNAFGGYTGEVYIDAYTLEGVLMWRINLGRNIRAGAHYTQFQVYDYDGDGRAEMAVRTSDGTIDGTGKILGNPNADWREHDGERPTTDRTGAVIKPDGSMVAPLQGRIMKGPEYLTIFDGLTGAALASEPFWPSRDPRTDAPTAEQMKEIWDDSYANRCDRFLAGTAYLDGQRPSIIMARGYYERTTVAAWNWRDGKLTKRWVFDSATPGNEAFGSQGNHSLSVADVDGDGRDEIIYGSMTLDDNGTGLWSAGLRHGDALHVGDFDLSNPGLERFGVNEQPSRNGGIVSAMLDAATGKILWTASGDRDNGRGIIMDIDPRFPGAESWSSVDPHLRDAKGNSIGMVKPESNKFAIWWDGDLLREQLENTVIYKWNWREQRSERLLAPDGVVAKGAPVLSGDIFGDWREEVIWAAEDQQSLRIYATPYPTEQRMVTLLHDSQYRVAIAWQNTTYNQPPHPSFFIGDGMKAPPFPKIIPRKLISDGGLAVSPQARSRADWAGQGQLFVGVNYQPVDRSPEQITRDIATMKNAGLQVIRMGELSWDYYEPRNGEFTFDAFDSVMDQMHEAGLKVILDFGGSIAPPWLHQEYPGATLVKEDGTTLYPARRYMVDISDPDYQRLMYRYADVFLKRYGNHPSVIAIGYNNEMGNGYRSFSEPVRQRFIAWLKTKHGDLAALNRAWATQRWARTLTDWDQIRVPDSTSPVERHLDMRRFWSDTAIDVLRNLDVIRRKHAPDKPVLSNLWPDGARLGFDWLTSYRHYATHGAFGYYAGNPIHGAFETMMMKGGMATPVWFNEFQAAGGSGAVGFYGEKNRSRMLAHLGLLNGGQAVLAWTFNSHLGGEEQTIFGLLNHDDSPSWKLDEWSRLSKEFQVMQTLGFPRELNPEVAISYSWVSRQAVDKANRYYSTPYMDQKHNAYEPLYNDNMDVDVINITYENLSRYKLLVIPGEYLMDRAATDAVRNYVSNGGTVVMTAASAKANTSSQWYNVPLPGNLSDVFGLKTSEFYNNKEPLTGSIDGVEFKTTINFYEVLEPTTAEVTARFTNIKDAPPAVTVNRHGKGRAIYVATHAQPSVLQPLYRQLCRELGIKRGPITPEGVHARVVNGRTLYVNTAREPVEIEIEGRKKGILSGKTWSGKLRLEANGVDVLE